MHSNPGIGFGLFLLVLTTACATPAVEFEPYYFAPEVTMKAKIVEDVGGVEVGERVDFVDDLGIDDEDFVGGKFKWFTGDNSWIRLDYLPVSYDADEYISRPIEFNGIIYNVGDQVMTDLEMDYLRLGWAWQFIDVNDGAFKLGSLLEVKGYLIDGSLDTSTTSDSESLDFALPTVGFVTDFQPIDMLNFYGEASGIWLGDYGTAIDAEVGLKFIPVDMVTISAGYRVITFDVEIDDDEADVDLMGPYVAVSIRF